MTRWITAHRAALLALGVLAGTCAWLFRDLGAATGYRLLYPLDDTYIHLSLARTLIESGVWGVDATQPSSAGSSIAWVLLLAAARAVPGLADLAPGLLAVAGSVAVCFAGDRLLTHAGVSVAARAVVLSAVVVFTPLPVLSALGMEHSAFCAVLIAWVVLVEFSSSRRATIGAAILASVLVLLRPEGLLVAAAWGVARFDNRRVRVSAAAAIITALIAAYFMWQLAGTVLPMSALLKTPIVPRADASLPGEIVRLAILRIRTEPALLTLWMACAAAAPAVRQSPHTRWLRALLVLIPLHIIASEVGSLGRYEAYVVAAGILGATAGITRLRSAPRLRLAAAALALLSLPLLAWRFVDRADATVRFARTLAGVHVPLARFVAAQPGRRPVVADDIGIVSYFGGAPVIDLVGQATPAIGQARLAGTYSGELLGAIAAQRGARLAILEPTWFEGDFRQPAGWTKVAEFHVPAHLSDDYRLSLWSTSADSAAAVRMAIEAFGHGVPPPTEIRLF